MTDEALDVRLQRGAVELDEVVAIARLLAHHLDALHDKGDVDGAIDPSRIVCGEGTPKLLGNVDGARRAYTAPETWGGEPTAAGDQFAMASILYEAMCGGRAFPGDDSEKIRISMSTGRRVPLAARVPGLAEAVDVVFERALAIDPEERYPTCGAFADALVDAIDRSRIGGVLVQKPSSAPLAGKSRPPPPLSAEGFGESPSWSWTKVAVVLLVAVATAAIVSWLTK